MRAILASHPQVEWEDLLLRTQFALQQLAALSLQPSDSPPQCAGEMPVGHPLTQPFCHSSVFILQCRLNSRDDVG